MRGRLLIPLLACAFALALAGCGGGDDGTIPPDDADNLLNQLEAVQGYVDSGDCVHAEQQAAELINQVNELPNDVDPEVAGELTKAADNLRGLTSDPTQCTGASGAEGVQPTDTTDTTATTDTTDTETTQPETTVTETTTPEETSTQEQTTDEQPQQVPAPAGGGNAGGGGGNVTPAPGGGVEPPSGGVTPGGGGG